MADPWKVNMHPTHLSPTFKRDFNWLKLLQYVYIEKHKHTEVCMLTYFSTSKCYSAIKHSEKAKIFKRRVEGRRGEARGGEERRDLQQSSNSTA